LYNNTTGANNTASGYGALQSNTTASNNTAVGYQAAYSNTTGVSNNAFGFTALFSNTTGRANAAFGGNDDGVTAAALYSNTTGNYNTALGVSALWSNTTANNNTAVGYQALDANTTGANSTAVGYNALGSVTTGPANHALGYGAGSAITTGGYNVTIGQEAGTDTGTGSSITTGQFNICIGHRPAVSANAAEYQIVIGGIIAGKGDNTAFIGGTSGAYNGKNVTTWETTSDQRIKKNIVDNTVGLEKIKQIRVRNFEYRKPEEITELPEHAAVNKDGVQLGVIAQEIQQVLPECVTENSTGVLSVSTDPLVWHLINAVKELSAQVEQLKAKLGE
jgi:hypothetical protein